MCLCECCNTEMHELYDSLGDLLFQCPSCGLTITEYQAREATEEEPEYIPVPVCERCGNISDLSCPLCKQKWEDMQAGWQQHKTLQLDEGPYWAAMWAIKRAS